MSSSWTATDRSLLLVAVLRARACADGADLYVDLYVQDAQVHHLGARPPCQSGAARWRRHPSPAAYLLHTQWRRVSSPPPCAGAVLRLAPCGRERTTKMSLPRGTARSACASRAVGVHDRYENPVWSKSYRRLQLWYIVYTLYAVYTVQYSVLPGT